MTELDQSSNYGHITFPPRLSLGCRCRQEKRVCLNGRIGTERFQILDLRLPNSSTDCILSNQVECRMKGIDCVASSKESNDQALAHDANESFAVG